jgi:hypothetical protein
MGALGRRGKSNGSHGLLTLRIELQQSWFGYVPILYRQGAAAVVNLFAMFSKLTD